jgi:hypothetical protein
MGLATRRIEDAFEMCMFLVICHEDREEPSPPSRPADDLIEHPVVFMSDVPLVEGPCEETGLTIRRIVHPKLKYGDALGIDNEMLGLGIMAKCPVAMLFYIEDSITRLDLSGDVSVQQHDDVFQIRGTIVMHDQEARIVVDIPVGNDQDGNTWRLGRPFTSA